MLFGICIFPTFTQASVSKDKEQESKIQINSVIPEDNQKKAIDENTLVIKNTTDTNKKDTAFSGIGLFIRMVLVLALVILCIYIVVVFLKKGMTPKAQYDPFLRKVSSIPVSSNSSVQIISLLDHAYIIGVAENNISLLSEVKDKELIDAMNLYADKNQKTSKPKSFSDILDIFMPNGPHEQESSVFSETSKNASNLLKKQHDRLNDGNEL